MKDRIKLIMEKENLTSAEFADMLDINRAVISHILNGRNNPSLDVVTKIIISMDYINPDWLIKGTGNMYRTGFKPETISKEPDLFTRNEEIPHDSTANAKKRQEIELNIFENAHEDVDNKADKSVVSERKKITQIIIYYSDNTFEKFSPS